MVIVILVVVSMSSSREVSTTDTRTIYLYPNITEQMMETLWESDNEFLYCLTGAANDNRIIVRGFYEPIIISRSDTHVEAQVCKDSIGLIHSHPGNGMGCAQSAQDIYTFGASNALITCIVCDKDEIACYTPNSLTNTLNIEVGYG